MDHHRRMGTTRTLKTGNGDQSLGFSWFSSPFRIDHFHLGVSLVSVVSLLTCFRYHQRRRHIQGLRPPMTHIPSTDSYHIIHPLQGTFVLPIFLFYADAVSSFCSHLRTVLFFFWTPRFASMCNISLALLYSLSSFHTLTTLVIRIFLSCERSDGELLDG